MPAPPFTLRLPVRWGDLDQLGHVNNAVYMTYVEQARIEYLASLADGDAPWPGPLEHGPILAAADVRFKKPVLYPATVEVTAALGRVGRTSIGVDHVLTVEGDDAVCFEATTTLVWVDRATGRPTPLPDALREAAP